MQRFVNINQLWSYAITDELVRNGVRHAVISPGSRNTPIVLALAAHADITDHSVLDERSAAFFALGLAKASGEAVALVCTSGTAAANYFPAVCEADASNIPLLLLTADRPVYLRDSGAPQTMDQIKLYGDRVRWFMDAGSPEADEARLRALRSAVCHAYDMATTFSGPVHINVPFKKPLEPISIDRKQDLQLAALIETESEAVRGRADGRAWMRVYSAGQNTGALEEIADALLAAKRPVIIAGPDPEGGEHAAAIFHLAERHRIPVFAEAASQLRTGAERPFCYPTLDLLLRSAAFRELFNPDLILQLGGVPTNTMAQRFLAHTPADHLCIAADHSRRDASHTVRVHVADSDRSFFGRLADLLSETAVREADEEFLQNISIADAEIRKFLTSQFAAMHTVFEGAVMHRMAAMLPAETAVFVSSSMPIRDVESFALRFAQGTKLYFNRGVNGIDGIVSTALGMARANGGPALLITGDIAFLHNLNAAAGEGLREIPLTVLLINNDGGQIFDMLPVREFDPAYTRHFTTPHGVDFSGISSSFGIAHRTVEQIEDLQPALEAAFASARMSVLEVRTVISESGKLRRSLLRDLAASVAVTLGSPKPDIGHTRLATPRDGEEFRLSWRILSRAENEAVVFLHGFTRSSSSWQPVVAELGETNAIGVDLMGHGASPSPDPSAHLQVYGLEHAAGLLRGIITRLGLGQIHLVGYSLGGRTALHFAAQYPQLLRSLTLISANPGIEDEAERDRRREADAELALRIESIGLERFITEWSNGPLFAAQRSIDPMSWRSAQRDRLQRRSRGLQGSLLGSGQGAQQSLWEALPGLQLPVLIAAGAEDGRYAEIASRMHALLANSELRIFPDAGHDLLFERGKQLAEEMRGLWKR